MTDRFISYINNNLVILLPFCKINKKLTKFTSYQISIGIPPDNDCSLISSQVIDEVNRCVYKHIDIELRKTTIPPTYIDLRKYQNMPFAHKIDDMQMYDIVFSYINRSGYKNLISSARISSEMQDNIRFNFFTSNSGMGVHWNNGQIPYKVGNLDNTTIWADPYLKFIDDKVILFDEIEINFEIKHDVIDDYTSVPKIIVEVNLCIDNINSNIVSLIESINSPSYSEYISTSREIKIDEIIK